MMIVVVLYGGLVFALSFCLGVVRILATPATMAPIFPGLIDRVAHLVFAAFPLGQWRMAAR